jgi:hypothetical protein
MSLIAVTLNLLLAGLLVAALMVGLRLDAKLKALRASHEGFAKAVADLDAAALRAEQALADLRGATGEVSAQLGERMDRARALVSKLDERLARPVPSDLDLRREALEARIGPAPTPPLEVTSARSRVAVDDDLFEGVTLKALIGGRR